MYLDLGEVYWWNEMNKDIAEFMVKCPIYQQVKVKHPKLGGLSQNISINTQKQEDLNMNFMIGLPHTQQNHDLIWVIVDRMTMSTHFDSHQGFTFAEYY